MEQALEREELAKHLEQIERDRILFGPATRGNSYG